MTKWLGIEPRTTVCKDDTLPQDYLPDDEQSILHLFVTLNTTNAFKRLVILLPGGLPVFINSYGVPFWSYYMLVLFIDLHKQLLFASGKDPAQSFSDI